MKSLKLKEILNYRCYKLAMISDWFYKNNLSRMNDFGGHRNVPEPTYKVLLDLYLSKQCYPFVILVEKPTNKILFMNHLNFINV